MEAVGECGVTVCTDFGDLRVEFSEIVFDGLLFFGAGVGFEISDFGSEGFGGFLRAVAADEGERDGCGEECEEQFHGILKWVLRIKDWSKSERNRLGCDEESKITG